MMSWLEMLMLFRLLLLVIQSRKQKLVKLKKCISTEKLDKLTAENFAALLKQERLSTKDDIDDFVEKTDFDDRLKLK